MATTAEVDDLNSAMSLLGLYDIKQEETQRPAREEESFMSLLAKLFSFKGGDFEQLNLMAPISILEPISRVEMLGRWGADAFVKIGGDTPEERMLTVVRCYMAQLPMVQAVNRKPINSVIGEVFLCTFEPDDGKAKETFKCKYSRRTWEKEEKASDASVKYTIEQVSHHPPITACHAYTAVNGGMEVTLVDDFKGSFDGNIVLKNVGGARVVLHKYDEVYEVQLPDANVVPKGSWISNRADLTFTNEMNIVCEKTQMRAHIRFPKKKMFRSPTYEIHGYIHRLDDEHHHLYNFHGPWNKEIFFKKRGDEHSQILCSTSDAPKYVQVLPPVDHMDPNHSVRLWSKVTELMKAGNYAEASKIKSAYEQRQREYFKKLGKKEDHKPRFYERLPSGASGEPGMHWKFIGEN